MSTPTLVRSVTSPKQFYIGAGLLEQLQEYVKTFGNSALLVCDEFILDRVQKQTVPAFQQHQLQGTAVKFSGECTNTEIQRLCHLSEEKRANVIVGIGGGKTLDSAKATAYQLKLPVVIVPTIAATDAPCTALAVIYRDNGEFDHYLFLPQNPDVVIADLNIIAKAPIRFFAAGIGDALATYFEARACYQADGVNLVLKRPSSTGLGLARMCYDMLCANAEKAMDAVRHQIVTPALEQTIEATIYLSGVGAESGGLAAAHAVSNGLSAIADLHRAQHGEKVGFGLLTQLILENAPEQELNQVLRIMQIAGLPMTMRDLGVKSFVAAEWQRVAELSCDKDDTMGNMPMSVTVDEVYAAMIAADALGQRYQKQQPSSQH